MKKSLVYMSCMVIFLLHHSACMCMKLARRMQSSKKWRTPTNIVKKQVNLGYKDPEPLYLGRSAAVGALVISGAASVGAFQIACGLTGAELLATGDTTQAITHLAERIPLLVSDAVTTFAPWGLGVGVTSRLGYLKYKAFKKNKE